MREVSKIFFGVFVQAFYKTYASLFFLAGGVVFGFMRGNDHIALGELLISSPMLLLIPIVFWILYGVCIATFNRDAMYQEQNECVLHAVLLPTYLKRSVMSYTIAYQLLPILAYGFFLMVLAIRNDQYRVIPMLVIALVAIMVYLFWKLNVLLHHPDRERKQNVFEEYVSKQFTKPSVLFFIEWIIRQEPLAFFGAKFFSLSLLFGVTQLYKFDTYDARLLGMGIVVAVMMQIRIVWENHRFDNHDFVLLRSLPETVTTKVIKTLLVNFLLLFAECGLLISNFPTSLSVFDFVGGVLIMISLPLLIHGFLFVRERTQEQLMTITFFLTIAWIVAILFSIPLIVLAIVNSIAGIYLLKRYYYSFEYVESSRKEED